MGALKALLWLLFRIVVICGAIAVKILFLVLDTLNRLGRAAASTTFGSARWATLLELLRSGSWRRDGLIVAKRCGRFIRYRHDGFVLLFAPTRTGKGTSVVIPNLLSYAGSIIAIDIKGENHGVTGRSRAKRGPVWCLDVLAPETSDGFNPLDIIQVGTWHETDDARHLADLMIVPTSDGEHWDEKARQLITTLLLYVCHKHHGSDLCNLAQVRALACQDWNGLEATLQEALCFPSISLREEAASLLAMEKSDELKSIKSTMDKATAQWSADKPAGLISSRSSFRFEMLNHAVGTVFIKVPEEKLSTYRGFLRVMIGCAIVAMTRTKYNLPRNKTLFLLDEAAALGRLQPLEEGIGYLAAYVRMILVWQDLDQLERTYPRARSMIANAGCKVAFNVSDIDTARMLADQIGYTTTLSHSAGASQSNVELMPHNLSKGVSEAARYLIDPAEIMRMPDRLCLVIMPRQVRYPVLGQKIRYWREGCWRGGWDQWPGSHASSPPERRAYV